MKFSIIVPTYKHLEDLLKPCLESLLKYTDLTDGEVIVVRNGPDDGTDAYVNSLGDKFLLLSSDEALGFTAATNLGIRMAKGENIILLNNDTILLYQEKNDWIHKLLDPMKDDVGITGPLMQFCPYAGHNFIVFFCVAINKKVFEKCGYLDEIFSPGGGEDTDLCIKAEQAGFKVIQVPTSNLSHGDGFMVGNFPIYHKAESTMLDEEHSKEWYEVIERNRKTLSERYTLPDGMFWEYDIKEYRKLVEEVPDYGTICELGTWKGRSLCSVADIIKRKNLHVIAVDTFEGTLIEDKMVADAKREDVEAIFRANIKRFGLEPIVHRATTDEASKLVEDGSLDLCFIDADHSYEGIKNDFINWKPKVKKGGVIGGHDYNGMAWQGVRKFVDEQFREVHYEYPSLVWSKQIDN